MPQPDQASKRLIFMSSRPRMLLRLGIYGFGIALLLLVIVMLSYPTRSPGTTPYPVLKILGIAASILGILLLLAPCLGIIYRFMRPAPALIVHTGGIVNNASLVYRGVGFTPWSKISSVCVERPMLGPRELYRAPFLVITTSDLLVSDETLEPSLRMQRKIARLLLRPPSPWSICIPRFMLAGRLDGIVQEIGDAYSRWRPVESRSRHAVRFGERRQQL